MKKIYYLSTCSTCRRIIKEVNPDNSFIFQDLKEIPISPVQLDHLYKLSGSYISIFNKQARKYRELGLHNEDLSESQIRKFILTEYTFLKRPIFIIEEKVFIGSNRKVIAELKEYLQKTKKVVEQPIYKIG